MNSEEKLKKAMECLLKTNAFRGKIDLPKEKFIEIINLCWDELDDIDKIVIKNKLEKIIDEHLEW